MNETPTAEIKGQQFVFQSRDDVLSAFQRQSQFFAGKQIEELIIDQIDAELDYDTGEECHILRCHVYFDKLEAVNMGYIGESALNVKGWTRESQSIGEGRMRVVYEKQV